MWDIAPLVAVTLTEYIPTGVADPANTVRMEPPAPPEASVTLPGLNCAGRFGTATLEVEDRLTVPERPLILAMLITDVPFELCRIFRALGLAVMLKSGGKPYAASWVVTATGVGVPLDIVSLRMRMGLAVLLPAV